MFEPYLEKQKLFARRLKFMLRLQGFLKHIYTYKVCETFCPALGMCPTVYQSVDVTRHGRMKKASNRRANWMLIQAANIAAMHDDRLKDFYER